MEPLAASASHSPSESRRYRWWAAIWLILAVAHVTQGIWSSGGASWPGGLGDGRFNQLVLEHGYQALRGNVAWLSPAQFHPVHGTLALSDTHAGTLPIYAFLRTAGLGLDRAWQGWFIVVVGLNMIAGLRLLTALGVVSALRPPLAFAATSSVTMAWVAGTHAQLLPQFPALLAFEQLARWSEDKSRWRIVAASGWLAWQFAATPYVAFFALLVGVPIAVVRAVLRTSTAGSLTPLRNTAPQWVRAWTIFAAGCLLAGAALSVYLTADRAAVGFEEVLRLAPSFSDWWKAAPVHALYSTGWPADSMESVERAWLSGYVTWILLPIACVVGWRTRSRPHGAWTIALAAGFILVTLFLERWSSAGTGLWLTLAEHIPELRAFRAVGRVAVILQPVLVAMVALLLTWWHARSRSDSWRHAPLLLAVAVAVEGLASSQPVTAIETANARTQALIDAWKANGDAKVIAFAPGHSNQPLPWIHLDAWAAAQRLGRKTVNGYSGRSPASHLTFVSHPTAANARALMTAAGISPQDVTVVTSLGAEVEARLGFEFQTGTAALQLPGSALQPIATELAFPLEIHEFEAESLYQFTPPVELHFEIPPSATSLTWAQAYRLRAYTADGNSDGVGITWSLSVNGEGPKIIHQEHFNPRDNAAHRGIAQREVPLPSAGARRRLILKVDVGPNADGRWDWPLFGRFGVR